MRYLLLALLAGGLAAAPVWSWERKKDKADKAEATEKEAAAQPEAPAEPAIPVPVKLTEADLTGTDSRFLEKHFVISCYTQKMQFPDGSLSQEPGRVVVLQRDGGYVIAFYRALDGAFVLVGQAVMLSDVFLPREDVHPTQNVPCLIARRLDGQGAWRVFLQDGKVAKEAALDDASATPSKNPPLPADAYQPGAGGVIPPQQQQAADPNARVPVSKPKSE